MIPLRRTLELMDTVSVPDALRPDAAAVIVASAEGPRPDARIGQPAAPALESA